MSLRKTYPHFVFTYGTLQRGEPNHHWISEKGHEFQLVGRAKTVNLFPLVIASRFNIPYLMDKPGTGKQINGELYRAGEDMVKHLDILEDYPKHYTRRQERVQLVEISEKDSEFKVGDVINGAWIYLLADFKAEMLQLPFLTEYKSKGPHGLAYVER